jgi:hypothetical protein
MTNVDDSDFERRNHLAIHPEGFRAEFLEAA